MNIISSNCFAGYLYRDLLHYRYENPFIWTCIHNDDFLFLLEHFDEINFRNYEILKQTNDLYKFKIRIDNKFEVFYNHHIFSKEYNIPTKIGINVFYNKIWEYIKEKYEYRLTLMSKHIDLVAVDDFGGYDIKKIYTICKQKKIKLFMCTDLLPEETSENCIIRRRFKVDNHGPGPGDIHLKYGNLIKEFLGIK